MKWEDGVICSGRISTSVYGKCTLRSKSPIVIQNKDDSLTGEYTEDGLITFDCKPDQVYEIKRQENDS